MVALWTGWGQILQGAFPLEEGHCSPHPQSCSDFHGLWGWGCGDHQRGSSVLLSGVIAVGAIPELTHTSHSLPSKHAMLIIWQMKTLGDVGKFMHMMETLAPPAGQIHQTLPEAALCVCVCVCVYT